MPRSLPTRTRWPTTDASCGAAGFAEAVHRIVKYVVIASLFAVAMLGGGEVPILHASQFADAHALAHEQMDHVLHDHVHDVGTVTTPGTIIRKVQPAPTAAAPTRTPIAAPRRRY